MLEPNGESGDFVQKCNFVKFDNRKPKKTLL
jgi:hypothetical protein